MFKVEIKNLSIKSNIGITAKERKVKQLLKVSLTFNYIVNKSKDLNTIKNLKSYSSITKYLSTNHINHTIVAIRSIITNHTT